LVAETATSLRRGLAVLLALAGDDAFRVSGLGVTRIAALVGREKTQVSRSLKVLGEYGMVERDPHTLEYRLGWRLFAIAAAAGDHRLLDSARPVLRQLVHELGERAHLSTLQGRHVLTVMSESPDRAVQTAGWIGRTVPLHCTSAGRALLFDHDRTELAALLGGVDFASAGAGAPRDVTELHRRITAARAVGYALVDEEFEPGLVAVAAPIRDFRGSIVAAVNVSAPKFRFGSRLEVAGRAVRRAAHELSSELGWDADRPPLAPREGTA